MIDYAAIFANFTGSFPNIVADNVSAPGAGDGTEFIKALVDDNWGFSQALLDYTDDTPNSVTEAAGASQKLDSVVKIHANATTHAVTGTHTVKEWDKKGVALCTAALSTLTLAAGVGTDETSRVIVFNQTGSTINIDTGDGFETLINGGNAEYIFDGTSAFIRVNEKPISMKDFNSLDTSNDAGDTDHDINILSGSCRDSTDSVNLISASEITKQIDATWSAGDDAGGLDTGSVANDTWYYIYLIKKDSDGSIDALFSLSKTAPTMPAGYTYFRRIRGAVLTDGSANIIQFFQKDDNFYRVSRIEDINDASPGTSRNLGVVPVPPNMIGTFRMYTNIASPTYIAFGSPNEADVAVIASTSDVYGDGNGWYSSVIKNALVNASSQIYYRSDAATLNVLTIVTLGFIDPAQD